MNNLRKEDRRKEALERQEDRKARSAEEQIKKLDNEGWAATRERARLQKIINKGK
jgi:hypothetical protein